MDDINKFQHGGFIRKEVFIEAREKRMNPRVNKMSPCPICGEIYCPISSGTILEISGDEIKTAPYLYQTCKCGNRWDIK